MTSGDTELNPGPEQNLYSQTILSVGSTMLLNLQLRQLGSRPVDVVGEGKQFLISYGCTLYMVIAIITSLLDKLVLNTLAIILKVLLKAILKIHGMNNTCK